MVLKQLDIHFGGEMNLNPYLMPYTRIGMDQCKKYNWEGTWELWVVMEMF